MKVIQYTMFFGEGGGGRLVDLWRNAGTSPIAVNGEKRGKQTMLYFKCKEVLVNFAEIKASETLHIVVFISKFCEKKMSMEMYLCM